MGQRIRTAIVAIPIALCLIKLGGLPFALGVLLLGLVGSVLGQLGDLSFSCIKRQYGIKDYGRLLPGHGGVLDRFDSLTLVAPAMEVLLVLLPMAV